MIKKINYIKICFLIFLFAGFFFFPINKIYAVNLEVSYPPIPGVSQTITPEINLPDYLKYIFYAGMVLGFLAVLISLTVAGVMFFLSPAKPDWLSEAKDRVSGAISGLLILVLTYLIITTINPQLSIFSLNKLPPTPPPPAEKRAPGVYFYKSAGCSDKNVQSNTSNIEDLGELKNHVNSVGIVQDFDSQTYYITILHDKIKLWGKCQYITTSDPNNAAQTCQNVEPFASSASIYPYDFYPNSDGVYFYRKSCFNSQPTNNINDIVTQCNQNSGGYYKISNDDIIKNIKLGNPFFLESLYFNDVPYDEQDCTGYDKNGACVNRAPPSLGGENISSMIINGNYIVVLIYSQNGSWDSCQVFPTPDDVNKFGPQQIKWENIRNSGGVIPNYAIIIPIKR